jgi:hypothetical protein
MARPLSRSYLVLRPRAFDMLKAAGRDKSIPTNVHAPFAKTPEAALRYGSR